MTADRVTDPLIGRLLDGRYLVGPRVARGGMATVYEATDTRLDRTVAVKVMHAGLGDDDEFSRRFRREAQAAARLAHHNVVSVFDQGDDDGTLFLVMEYVPGITLRDLIRTEAPMSPARALTVIEPVLSALGAAHRAGMIHRDVKPENVLLADDGRVKVADFGLARAVNSESQHTSTGVLIGTVSYLSPELVVDGHADARSDVYAAGVLIYEMLTGQKPHQADSPIQVAYKHVHEDIPPPSWLMPSLPPYVDALVARATARDTSLRPADATVLLHQLRRVRHALEHGVLDDPELTADLAPATGRGRDPFEDTDGQLPRAIIDLSRADEGGGRGDSVPDDVYDQEREPTSTLARSPLVGAGGGGARTLERPSAVQPLPPRPRRSKRGPLLLVMLLVTALLVGLGGWYFGVARYTTTPGVINMTRAAAKVEVVRSGLAFDVTGTGYSETVAKGSVLRTDPAPGSRISKDGTVRAVISLGPERHAVPKVDGRTLDDAQAMLQESHLSFGRAIEKYSDTVQKGRVIKASPGVGTDLRRDTAVDLTVSKGQKPIEVPDFTGKAADDAEEVLDDLGLQVDSTSTFDDDVAKGKVIAQDPSDGTLFKGDTVELTVSKGPELIEVPRVVAMGQAAAAKRLEEAGFTVKYRNSATYLGLHYVLRSDPSAGSMVPKGSTITLYLV
ncbi:MAG TPA: Stk1 family PASTA domain-containing Ser/Thr kinase [Marmoricola sp.]|nr:Stk1 family PASTA domain-containing Ser/Thr kinase [Marmoricola sp.]